ncbi:MAG: tetratricopeptide repeat protein [Bacteroidales bacterium]|nr:tetratricopeptide repeat protein [Bacteroidales bacterium]MBN2757476.1 tetratricopeptide repeat protein [Bacteroidales bacterium]
MKNLSYRIKIITLSILFISLNASFTFSQADSLYKVIKLANDAYNKSEFEKALDYYKIVINQGFTSSELYYNIGNSYYRLKDYKNAILFYEKAKLLEPDNEDITTNLEHSYRFIQDKIDDIPEIFFLRWIDGFASMFSTKIWSWISIVSFILFLLSGLIFLFSPKVVFRKLSFYFLFILISISILSYFNAYHQNNKYNKHKTAIVFSSSVSVKSSPNINGTDLFIIHEGLKVTIIDILDNWCEIKLSDGRVGWLHKDTIEEI